MIDPILGATPESRSSTFKSVDPCPHCDGPRRLLRRHGRGAPVTTCPACRVIWIAGAYAGRRLVHLGNDVTASRR